MNYNRKILAIAISVLCIVAGQSSYSQWTYGIHGGLNVNFHTPNFADPNRMSIVAPAGIDSSQFNANSSSLGFALGLMANYRLNPTISVTGRIGVNSLSGSISANSRRYLAADTTAITSTLNSSILHLEIMPGVQFSNLFGENIPLYLLSALEIGVPLISEYSQTDASVIAGQRIPGAIVDNIARTTVADIPNSSTRFALALGAGYPFALSPSVLLAPEVSYRLPLGDISGNASLSTWSVPQLRIGLALTFGNNNKYENRQPPSDLSIRMDEVGYYNNDGAFLPAGYLRVEDVSYSELFPLVPYYFFVSGKSAPSEQSSTELAQAGEFSISQMPQDAIEINKSVLNIIGARMKQYPDASLTIAGNTDGKTEGKNAALAKERAEFLKNHLTAAFGIAEQRINVVAQAMPAKPSSNSTAEGEAENRRAEFSSSNREILAPIVLKSDNQRIAAPEMLEFRPTATSSSGIADWSLTVSQAGKTLRTFGGNGMLEPQQWLIRPNELSASQISVDYTLAVSDSSGAKKEVNGSIPVEYLSSTKKRTENLADRTIAKFSLILFDFDKAEISEENSSILLEKILPSIQYNSIVKIYGYTDKLGDAAYNQKLSLRRAEAVKKILEAKVPDAKYELNGLGESVPIFDNKAILGRHLSRTVQIYVETPKK